MREGYGLVELEKRLSTAYRDLTQLNEVARERG